MHAYIVVDLGFGDSGKGLLTDFLVRHFHAGLVVRYNGGAQAGHNVVAPDGRHHTFSQFGSGTFIPGVKTYLSKQVVIHPGALLVEGDILVGLGIRDAFSRIRVSDQALVITPFHQAANRIREIARGQNRHGTCGVGVGEAVEDAITNRDDRILAGDLSHPAVLQRKCRAIRERKRGQLVELYRSELSRETLAREWQIFEREDIVDTWISKISRFGELGLVAPDKLLESWLHQTETVIFEGAQGVLLDANQGFHPYTTWSRCTAANAYDLITELAQGLPVSQVGVMRCYAIRHGPGPLPTETDALAPLVSEHNHTNDWQGAVRYGWFDAVLARYALDVAGKVDFLAVTHLDVLPCLKTWTYASGYQGNLAFPEVLKTTLSDGVLKDFRLPRDLPLMQREQVTQALLGITPVLESTDPDKGKVLQKIEELVGQPVRIVSSGPKAENVGFNT